MKMLLKIAGILITCLIGYCSANEVFQTNSTNHLRIKRSIGFKTVCYKEVGCFYTGPPFFNIPYRLISLPPAPPEVIRTVYLLFTRKNRNNPFSFSPSTLSTIADSHFNPSAWTRIIIHGLASGTYLASFYFELKDTILQAADENVIIVDHSTTSQFPRIILQQSAADCRLIGVQVAQMITFLKENFNSDLKKFHIIGHSFGAEIAGYAGEKLKNLGRITGLDPAGIYFQFVANRVVVDYTDATYVDIIHSNPAAFALFGLGTIEDRGHTNFWPAGGRPQGCVLTFFRKLLSAGSIFPTEALALPANCRHVRSQEFFVFSFNQNQCLFVGVECPSWEEFLDGRCNCGENGERCDFMGIYSSRRRPQRVRYYLQVGLERPFCLHQYQIILFFERSSVVPKTAEMILKLHVFGQNLIQTQKTLNIDMSQHLQRMTLLITSPEDLGHIHSANASLMGTGLHSTILKSVEINYLFPKSMKETVSALCLASSSHPEDNKKLIFLSAKC